MFGVSDLLHLLKFVRLWFWGQAPYSLDDSQTSTKEVDRPTRKTLCYDVAAGLKALHDSGVVHGDLHGSHVVIFDHPRREYIAKITGFSGSIIPSDSSTPQILPGTVPWNAPEVEEGIIEQGQIFQMDLFPLGLLIWKILVHQELFLSFDLPLDEAARNEEFKQIVVMPYLFRFIPLLIKHEVGLLEDNDFELLDVLFLVRAGGITHRTPKQTLLFLSYHASPSLKTRVKTVKNGGY